MVTLGFVVLSIVLLRAVALSVGIHTVVLLSVVVMNAMAPFFH